MRLSYLFNSKRIVKENADGKSSPSCSPAAPEPSPLREYLAGLVERERRRAPDDVEYLSPVTSRRSRFGLRVRVEGRNGIQSTAIRNSDDVRRGDGGDVQTILQSSEEELRDVLMHFDGNIRRAVDPSAPGEDSCLPASLEAIQRLPHGRIFPYHKEANHDDSTTCGICHERLIDGVALKRMPCGHVYHANCIVRWLHRTCTCPECRYEIETNDAAYEVGRKERMKDRKVFSCSCKRHTSHTCFFRSTRDIVGANKSNSEVDDVQGRPVHTIE